MKVPIAKPHLSKQAKDYAYKAMSENEIGVKSPYVEEFEEKLAEYTGYKYCLFVNSGWSALLLALRASGIKRITMPSFTMIACAEAAKQAGVEISFTDCNEKGLLEGEYGHPIMAVDIYGELSQARSEMFVIEDAAETFGQKNYYGDILCFSFFYNKILTVGQGGAVLTNHKTLYDEMKLFRHHYYDGESYYHAKDGYNVSQSGIHAAIGTKQLERIDKILEKRRLLGDRYVQKIGGWRCDEYWYFPFMCNNEDEKNNLKSYLNEKGVATRDFFRPLHLMPSFKQEIQAPNTIKLSENGLLLPLYYDMTFEEQDYVIHKVKDFYKI